MDLFSKCSFCDELVSTGRFVRIGPEQQLGLQFDMRYPAENFPTLWCCTHCYNRRFKAYMEDSTVKDLT